MRHVLLHSSISDALSCLSGGGMVARLFVCKQVNDIPMEAKQKELYEAPSTMVIEVKHEGVICASGGTEQFLNGNNYDDSFFD